MNVYFSNESLNFMKARLERILKSHPFLLQLQESGVVQWYPQMLIQPALEVLQTC